MATLRRTPGPLDLKHTLTFFGLLSDLVGAVLLSIPMIWNTRAAAHSILKLMKRVKFWLYGYSSPRASSQRPIFSRDVQEVHERLLPVGIFFILCFGALEFRLIEIFASKTPTPFLLYGAGPYLVVLVMFVGFACVILALYGLAKLPLYIALALIWIARGNHERRIGFVGLGILCIGFVLQATVNLM
jgi:hypothetical protein